MRESAKSARHNSLKLTIQRRGHRAPGGSQEVKQLDESLTAFSLYKPMVLPWTVITLRHHKLEKRKKRVAEPGNIY